MESEDLQHRSEEVVNLTIHKSTRNLIIAKAFIALCLTCSLGYFYQQTSIKSHKKGRELTKTDYLSNYEIYRSELLKSPFSENLFLSTLLAFMVIAILIGSYEIATLAIYLMIGKIVQR